MQPMTPALFDSLVLCKPYFDRHGLIVAEDEGQIVGFAHAGFGPNAEGSDIDRSTGVVCQLQVTYRDGRDRIAKELLEACHRYFQHHHTQRVFGGVNPAADPYYHGLVGGSQPSGVAADDTWLSQLLLGNGYEAVNQHIVLHRQLAGFRPAVDRTQMQIRRTHHVNCSLDPPSPTWWHACTWGHTERTCFTLQKRQTGGEVASLVLWDCEPIASSWGVHATGIAQLEVAADESEENTAIFLIGEALRQMQSRGVTLTEVQVAEKDTRTFQLYARLGFEEVDRSVTYLRSTPL